MNVIQGKRGKTASKSDDRKSGGILANTLQLPFGDLNAKKIHLNPPLCATDPEKSWRAQKKRVFNASEATKSTLNNSIRHRTPFNRNVSSSGRGGPSRSGSLATPFSATSSSTVSDSYVILAISEGRGTARGEVGVAAIDVRRPTLALTQLSDTHSYLHTVTKLNYFDPVEIIVPHTFRDRENESGSLYSILRDAFPRVKISAVLRKHFSEAAGLRVLRRLAAPEYAASLLSLSHKFYALTAAAALLKYIEFVRSVVFAPESLKIEFHRSQNSTYIDAETSLRLELVEYVAIGAGCSLLALLGRNAVTAGGRRCLRARILQPFCRVDTIEYRLDALKELLEKPHLMPQLQVVLRRLADVESVLWLCAVTPQEPIKSRGGGETQLNQVLILQSALQTMPSLLQCLDTFHSGFFQNIKKELQDDRLEEIGKRVETVLSDAGEGLTVGKGLMQRCFAVKAGVNGLLDVARRTFSELVVDLQASAARLAEEYSLPLKLHCEARGFRLVLPANRRRPAPVIPPIFIQVRFTGSTVSMTTEELILLDQQARESLNEIQSMTNIVIFGLLSELRPFLPCLYKLCEHVAELDVLVALAQASSAGNYVRPQFGSFLQLENCIHPLLAEVTAAPPEPNDVFASPEYNFHIITGPNMGGKSVYIKQIAILQVMAQIACYVPATKAIFRIADHIFSRCGFNDSIDFNASSYVLEMKEIHFILQMLSPNSLIIVDELCRGTSSEEGTSMAWAICEQLLATEAFTFFTTHFLFLTRLQDLYLNVTNLHTDARKENCSTGETGASPNIKLTYLHKIVPGVTQLEHYGLSLARSTNIPNCVVKLATELAELIAQCLKPLDLPQSNSSKKEEKLLYSLYAELMQKIRCGYDRNAIKCTVNKFSMDHPEFEQRLNALNFDEANTFEFKTPAPLNRNRAEKTTKYSTAATSSSAELIQKQSSSSSVGSGKNAASPSSDIPQSPVAIIHADELLQSVTAARFESDTHNEDLVMEISQDENSPNFHRAENSTYANIIFEPICNLAESQDSENQSKAPREFEPAELHAKPKRSRSLI